MFATPAADYEIDADLVARLIADQHPDFADLPLHDRIEGWDNVLFRLGSALAVRLPRRTVAAQLILHEQVYLPQLAPHLPLPTPVVYRTGVPSQGYPWHWSILPWFPGNPADQEPVQSSQATIIGAFLASLHTPANQAPENQLRGVPLQQRASSVEKRLHRLRMQTNAFSEQLHELWNTALHAPIDVEKTWLHGDLHPRNILVHHGRITAIIDWGDITAGDCATDLAAIWMLFDDEAMREQALQAYGYPSQATLQRSRGWALLFGVMLLDSGLQNNPRNAALGARILRNLKTEKTA